VLVLEVLLLLLLEVLLLLLLLLEVLLLLLLEVVSLCSNIVMWSATGCAALAWTSACCDVSIAGSCG
jgi:hypothetical protein